MDSMLPRLRTGALAVLAFLALAPAARAWTWPASGAVLRPFSLGDDPYLGGQHRGIDLAGKEAEPVLAPRSGTVAFAGSLPMSGLTVTLRTDDGYSVTLVHLGSVAVKRNAMVDEGDPVGTLGSSGDAEWAGPYVHLGLRLTSDPSGYLDPQRFLPARPARAAPPSATGTAPNIEPEPDTGPKTHVDPPRAPV